MMMQGGGSWGGREATALGCMMMHRGGRDAAGGKRMHDDAKGRGGMHDNAEGREGCEMI
jgi:hypothetical protein